MLWDALSTMKVMKPELLLAALFFLASPCAENTALAKRKDDKSGDKKQVKYTKSKDGLGALIALSKSRDAMVDELNDETRNYNKAKAAAENGTLKAGVASSDIQKIAGPPGLTFKEHDGKTTRWVYKPGAADLTKNDKVYLFFNEKDELERWEVLPNK